MKPFFCLLALSFSMCCHALPVGNPSEASLYTDGLLFEGEYCPPFDMCGHWGEWLNFRVGYYGDFTFARDMEIRKKSLKFHNIEKTKMWTNAAYLVVNYCNLIDAYVNLGETKVWMETFGSTYGASTNAPIVLETETGFSVGVGARATVWESNGFTIGFGSQFFWTAPSLSFVRLEGAPPVYTSGAFRWYEWQVDLAFSQRFYVCDPRVALIPYIGAKWARAKVDNRHFVSVKANIPIEINDSDNNKNVGWALGTTLVIADTIGVTVEGRWADETALFVNAQFRF